MIRLSVVTINYNNSSGLERTFASVFKQKFSYFEYIVIDGGSTDESVEIIKKNEKKLTYWVSERDNGIYHAMNKGIAKAKGIYLLFLNSGDALSSADVIDNMLKEEDDNIDLLYGNLKQIFPDGREGIATMPEFINVELLMSQTLFHPVTLIKKRLFQDYGYYDERLDIVADWAFFLKVIVLGNATQKHKNIVVTDFPMNGFSSLPSNLKQIEREREWVKTNYLSPAFVKLYEDYLLYKNFYNNKWARYTRKLIDKLR